MCRGFSSPQGLPRLVRCLLLPAQQSRFPVESQAGRDPGLRSLFPSLAHGVSGGAGGPGLACRGSGSSRRAGRISRQSLRPALEQWLRLRGARAPRSQREDASRGHLRPLLGAKGLKRPQILNGQRVKSRSFKPRSSRPRGLGSKFAGARSRLGQCSLEVTWEQGLGARPGSAACPPRSLVSSSLIPGFIHSTNILSSPGSGSAAVAGTKHAAVSRDLPSQIEVAGRGQRQGAEAGEAGVSPEEEHAVCGGAGGGLLFCMGTWTVF